MAVGSTYLFETEPFEILILLMTGQKTTFDQKRNIIIFASMGGSVNPDLIPIKSVDNNY